MTNFICRDAVQVAMDMSRSLCLIQDNLNFTISEAVEGLFKAGEILHRSGDTDDGIAESSVHVFENT